MKPIFYGLAVMAIANLLALGALVGWLGMNDRLDAGRVQRVRDLFSKTLGQEQAEAEELARQREAESAAESAARKASRAPLTATEQLAMRVEATELDRQRVELLKAEVQSLRETLARDQESLGAALQTLAGERKAFAEQVEAANKVASDKQFRTSLAVIESLKPEDATSAMMSFISNAEGAGVGFAPADGGVEANAAISTPDGQTLPTRSAGLSGKGLVVAYLNAMEERQRGKIMTEIVRADPGLAAELLEMLRTHGQFVRGPASP